MLIILTGVEFLWSVNIPINYPISSSLIPTILSSVQGSNWVACPWNESLACSSGILAWLAVAATEGWSSSWSEERSESVDEGKLGAGMSSSRTKHIKSPETIPYEAKVSSSPVRASLLFNVIANRVSELPRKMDEHSKSYLPIFHNPFLVYLTLKPEPFSQSCQVLLFARLRTCLCSITSFQWFSSLPRLGCSAACSQDQCISKKG